MELPPLGAGIMILGLCVSFPAHLEPLAATSFVFSKPALSVLPNQHHAMQWNDGKCHFDCICSCARAIASCELK
jgi:hypothetical protein